jgi:hypothetical protein
VFDGGQVLGKFGLDGITCRWYREWLIIQKIHSNEGFGSVPSSSKTLNLLAVTNKDIEI